MVLFVSKLKRVNRNIFKAFNHQQCQFLHCKGIYIFIGVYICNFRKGIDIYFRLVNKEALPTVPKGAMKLFVLLQVLTFRIYMLFYSSVFSNPSPNKKT